MRVRNKRRKIVLSGKKDRGNWCWRTCDTLKKLDMEETWASEYTGNLGERRRSTLRELTRRESRVEERGGEKESTQYVRKGEGDLKRERYLDFLRGEEMRGVLDLRVGANDLEIDRGRQEKKPRAERICKICNDGVEDEVHVVTRCTAYHEQENITGETETEWSSGE